MIQEPTPPPSQSEEQGVSVAIHLGGLFTSVIVPLVLWLIYRDRSAFLNEHAKAALNWQILLLPLYLIAWVIIAIPFIGVIGSILQFGVFVISAVFCILSAVAAYSRQSARYPELLTIIR